MEKVALKKDSNLRAETPSGSEEKKDLLHFPDARESSMLILHVLHAKEGETKRELTRARISQMTFRRLCGRGRVAPQFEFAVQEHLLAAGWAFFCVGPSYYALIKVKAVEGWVRVSSKRINNDLSLVARGKYNFGELEALLLPEQGKPSTDTDDDDE